MSDENPEVNFVEISLKDDASFLKIKETLQRIGMGSYKNKELTATCNILQKKGRFYIVHFKEIFLLDGKDTTLTHDDVKRRNTIIYLLREWGLLDVVDDRLIDDRFANSKEGGFRVISFQESKNWKLIAKYTIGQPND